MGLIKCLKNQLISIIFIYFCKKILNFFYLYRLASKLTLSSLDDMDYQNLLTIFKVVIKQIISDEDPSHICYKLIKNFCEKLTLAKPLLIHVSKTFSVNISLEQAFSVLRGLELFDWDQVDSP